MTKTRQWHKLDRDRTAAMIDHVRSDGDHILFSIATSEAKCAKLSFYKNLLVYRLSNYSSLPSFSFDYLGDGRSFYHLDGSPLPIYAVNDSGNLILNPETVVDYISFFFEHVSGPDGDIYVIDDPHDHPVLDALDPAQLEIIQSRQEPPDINSDGAGGFIVTLPLFYLGILVKGTLHVDAHGRIDVRQTQMLLARTGAATEQGASL